MAKKTVKTVPMQCALLALPLELYGSAFLSFLKVWFQNNDLVCDLKQIFFYHAEGS